ncbi:hypothetical protein B0T18DRAFT_428540 [Schizothecium vesticola]|uniref:SET domain-containing protein n=1 Tax=Schizothecium vesticola TaxID=314040 RepID=A0AA40F3Q0_9PEZI|nr:hypothetical protein B0T18DRAFT_428540 [Schizothecium vesticola]
MIKEPFLHSAKGGCIGIWVLHWTSDLVWVGRHADCMPKHWRRGPEPGNEADFWIEKAMEIVGTDVLRSVLTEEALLQDVLCIDQALRFDLSDCREDGQELWFQFTKTRADRLTLLEFEEEALFGLLQSWALNRFTEMPPAGKGKGKEKEKEKREPFTNPLETCALRQHDRILAAFFRPAERTCFESPRCRNLAALARQLCLESELEAFDPMHALRIVEILCRLGHVTIAAEILIRARARDPRILSKSTKDFQAKIVTQLQQRNTPDAVLKLRSSLNLADTEMGLYRKSVRLQRLKAPRRGRGLFTNRVVKAGDCLLCELSMVACETKTPIEDDTKTSMEANLDDVPARLSYLLLNYVLHSPSSARQLAKFSLEGHGEPTVDPRLVVDGRPVIDGRLVERIVEQKTIDCLMISYRGDAKVVSGVWFMASFINRDRSGVPNVKMEMTDNVLKIDALQDLPKGTELVAAPQPPPRDFRGKKSGKVTPGFREDRRKLAQNILGSIRRAAGIPASDSSAPGSSADVD